ncbi:hypothetical protein QUB56_34355, partial [Microcoleus sp. AR_TQ3_B6]|uniref:hypothetical protein n=1 Tax=Microcoleus sp. AR_TQ3_B6 TaxID=3055284 RepID=UPI002FD4D59D
PSSFFLLPSSFFLLPSSFFLLPSSFCYTNRFRPLAGKKAQHIHINSGSIGINITHNQDTAVPCPYN